MTEILCPETHNLQMTGSELKLSVHGVTKRTTWQRLSLSPNMKVSTLSTASQFFKDIKDVLKNSLRPQSWLFAWNFIIKSRISLETHKCKVIVGEERVTFKLLLLFILFVETKEGVIQVSKKKVGT